MGRRRVWVWVWVNVCERERREKRRKGEGEGMWRIWASRPRSPTQRVPPPKTPERARNRPHTHTTEEKGKKRRGVCVLQSTPFYVERRTQGVQGRRRLGGRITSTLRTIPTDRDPPDLADRDSRRHESSDRGAFIDGRWATRSI